MWNYEASRERLLKRRDALPEITISDLTRQATLANITFAAPKRVQGVHAYLGLSNADALIEEPLDPDDQDAARGPVRRTHLWQRELSRVVADFDAAKIHFQGTRLHTLTYRPVSDEVEIAVRAVLLQASLGLATRELNSAFDDDVRLQCAAGAAFGSTLGTRAGEPGDSELLFIGPAANRAAKIIDPAMRLRVDADLFDLIDGELDLEEAERGADGAYRVRIAPAVVEVRAEKLKVNWTRDLSYDRVANDLEKYPVTAFSVSEATGEISKDKLGRSSTKLNHAVTLFGDLDGFTATVEQAESDDEKAALLRTFHLIRRELRDVAVCDFARTLRVQYQGDRIQVLRHLPHDDESKRVDRAIYIAAGWESSMRHTIPEVAEVDGIALATGIDVGPTLVSRLGEHGNRDPICLGPAVRRAEKIQVRLDGSETGISAAIRDQLPDELAALYEWRDSANAYVAEGVDINKLEFTRERAALEARAGAEVKVTDKRVSVLVGSTPPVLDRDSSYVTPRRRWSPES
jgi:class 3 adenylate cyclase